MATVNVKIVYTGRPLELDRAGADIPRIFTPDASYVDLPAMTEGYENEKGVGDGEGYGKSIYATNVDGWGHLPGLLPMAHTSVPMAQFERAAMAAFEAMKKDEENKGIEFEVEGYREELYWNQIAPNMVEQGFYIQVGDKEYGKAPESSEGENTPANPDDGEGSGE